MSRRPTAVNGDLAAKEAAVIHAAMDCGGEDLPPAMAQILASPAEFLISEDLRWVASRIMELRRNGMPTSPQVLIHEDKNGTVARLASQPVLPVYLAEFEAEIIVQAGIARHVAEQLKGIPERLIANPERAPEVAEMAGKGLLAAFDRVQMRKGLSVRSPDEILSMPSDPAENLMGNRLLTRGGRLVIAGAGGVGKSRLSLQLAASVISGREFLTLPTYGRGTRWLALQAENDNVRLKADLGALKSWLGDDWGEVSQRLVIHTLETEQDVFLSLGDDIACTAIRRLLDRVRPDVVVWDSLYNFATGDLNKDADMRETLVRLHQVSQHGNPKRAIVVLHHATTGRAGMGKLTGFDRASFGRNSKVLHSWARGQINVGPVSPNDNDTLAIACGKASNGREFAPFAIRLDEPTMIYVPAPDVDVEEALEQAVDGKRQERIDEEDVADLASGKTKLELANAIRAKTGCVKGAAYKAIIRAEEAGVIRLHTASETYQDRRVKP